MKLEAGVASDSLSLLLHDIPRPVGFTSKRRGAWRKEQGPPWWDGGWVVRHMDVSEKSLVSAMMELGRE